MKSIGVVALAVCLLFATVSESFGRGRGVSVRGYSTRRGTNVAPHHRTSPNHRKRDNWSNKGNVNPYTGKAGTKSGNGLVE